VRWSPQSAQRTVILGENSRECVGGRYTALGLHRVFELFFQAMAQIGFTKTKRLVETHVCHECSVVGRRLPWASVA
jgi:hypothetical protein